MNKSIEGTADDEEEGVSPDSAIRSGLELLKVFLKQFYLCLFLKIHNGVPFRVCNSRLIYFRLCKKNQKFLAEITSISFNV